MEDFPRKLESDTQSTPEKGLRYFYVDNSNEGKVVFKCETKDILEADTLFEKATGINPTRNPHIGRIIESDINKNWISKQKD